MNERLVNEITNAVSLFCDWLDRFGETSFDHQSFFASDVGRMAKALYYRKPLLGKLAVAPMIFCEAFAPSTRGLFWKAQRFPIADAHYAMAFAFLFETFGQKRYYERAVHFLQVLKETRCPRFERYCWGYPFNWETRNGTMTAGTPLITTVPYVYEAFRQVHQIDGKPHWRELMRSIAKHALEDYGDIEIAPNVATCSYAPDQRDAGGVINASAYRAFLLTAAAADFADDRYGKVAERNLNFVLASQNSDGSWFYSTDGVRDFVDHFHTCFVLKALSKIERITRDSRCSEAIERGVRYYVTNLFDAKSLPMPFSKAPRLTVYRRELYDYAECINLGVLLYGRFEALDRVVSHTVEDLFARWRKADGSFRARELLFGWDNVPMHRWAESQVFRSLCFLLFVNMKTSQSAIHSDLQPLQSEATN